MSVPANFACEKRCLSCLRASSSAITTVIIRTKKRFPVLLAAVNACYLFEIICQALSKYIKVVLPQMNSVEKLLNDFTSLQENWIAKAEAIVKQHSGSAKLVPLGLFDLDRIGLDVAAEVERFHAGTWPREILTLLGRTMRRLVELAQELKCSLLPKLVTN